MLRRNLIRSGVIGLAATLLVAPIVAAQTPPVSALAAANPDGYSYKDAFPVEIPGLGFAMSKQDFLDVLAAKKLTPTTNGDKTMFLVQPRGAAYTSVVYFFNSNAGPILTELEVRFADNARAKAWFDAKFPQQTRRYGGEEYFSNDGVRSYSVKAWCFGQKVFIVATMPETRWASEK